MLSHPHRVHRFQRNIRQFELNHLLFTDVFVLSGSISRCPTLVKITDHFGSLEKVLHLFSAYFHPLLQRLPVGGFGTAFLVEDKRDQNEYAAVYFLV